jgi:hypothetical protein
MSVNYIYFHFLRVVCVCGLTDTERGKSRNITSSKSRPRISVSLRPVSNGNLECVFCELLFSTGSPCLVATASDGESAIIVVQGRQHWMRFLIVLKPFEMSTRVELSYEKFAIILRRAEEFKVIPCLDLR